MLRHSLLESAVRCLRSESTWPVVGPEHYWNRDNVIGQYACYKEAGHFLTISIHNCPKLIDAPTQADLVEGIEEIAEDREGLYCNKKFVPGYFVSALSTVPLSGSTHHWVMIGLPNPNVDGFEEFKQYIQRKWNRKNISGHHEFFESELWSHGFREIRT